MLSFLSVRRVLQRAAARHSRNNDQASTISDVGCQDEEVALAVLRVLTIPALHRLSCLQALHSAELHLLIPNRS